MVPYYNEQSRIKLSLGNWACTYVYVCVHILCVVQLSQHYRWSTYSLCDLEIFTHCVLFIVFFAGVHMNVPPKLVLYTPTCTYATKTGQNTETFCSDKKLAWITHTHTHTHNGFHYVTTLHHSLPLTARSGGTNAWSGTVGDAAAGQWSQKGPSSPVAAALSIPGSSTPPCLPEHTHTHMRKENIFVLRQNTRPFSWAEAIPNNENIYEHHKFSRYSKPLFLKMKTHVFYQA